MSYTQLTIRGWPDKASDQMTRVLLPAECENAAIDIMTALGGMFYVESAKVDEAPVLCDDERARAADIIQAGFNRFCNTH